MYFKLRERRKKTTAAENGKIIIYRIKCIILKRFPDLWTGFKSLTDCRKRKEYSMQEVVAGALFMFIFKETSRNAYNGERGDMIFATNYSGTLNFICPIPIQLIKSCVICRHNCLKS